MKSISALLALTPDQLESATKKDRPTINPSELRMGAWLEKRYQMWSVFKRSNVPVRPGWCLYLRVALIWCTLWQIRRGLMAGPKVHGLKLPLGLLSVITLLIAAPVVVFWHSGAALRFLGGVYLVLGVILAVIWFAMWRDKAFWEQVKAGITADEEFWLAVLVLAFGPGLLLGAYLILPFWGIFRVLKLANWGLIIDLVVVTWMIAAIVGMIAGITWAFFNNPELFWGIMKVLGLLLAAAVIWIGLGVIEERTRERRLKYRRHRLMASQERRRIQEEQAEQNPITVVVRPPSKFVLFWQAAWQLARKVWWVGLYVKQVGACPIVDRPAPEDAPQPEAA